jgi:hypothetical protein
MNNGRFDIVHFNYVLLIFDGQMFYMFSRWKNQIGLISALNVLHVLEMKKVDWIDVCTTLISASNGQMFYMFSRWKNQIGLISASNVLHVPEMKKVDWIDLCTTLMMFTNPNLLLDLLEHQQLYFLIIECG